MNVAIITGRVGRDSELRSTKDGTPVLGFALANDIGFGERKRTQWFECSLWGKRAEALAQYIRKGDKVTVSGEVSLEEYNKRDGSAGSKLVLRVSEIELGGSKEGGAGQSSANRDNSRGGGSMSGGRPAPRPSAIDELNDEILFLIADVGQFRDRRKVL